MANESATDVNGTMLRITLIRPTFLRILGMLLRRELPFAITMLAWLAPGEVHAGLGTWTTGGPETGLVVALAVDPLTSGVVYAGAQFGGVFKSATGGDFWTKVNNGLTTLQIHALAVDPQTPGVAYAGTTNGGLFKTTNGGTSWVAINNGLPFPANFDFVYAVAIDPTTPTTLYAGTASGGIFKSTNGGASWFRSFTAGMRVFRLAIDPATPTTVYAGTLGGGAFKTVDGGANWSAINNGLTNLTIEDLVVDPKTPATLYAATFGGGVFKSVTGGATWNAANGGLPSLFLEALAIDPSTPLTLYAGLSVSGIFKSINGGTSWFAVNGGLPASSAVAALAVNPLAPTTIYAGVYGDGVFKSTNGGGTWSPSNASLVASAILTLAADPQNRATLYAGARRGGAFKSTNGGASWRPSGSGITDRAINALAVNPQAPSILYAGTSQTTVFQRAFGSDPMPGAGGVFKSIDGGASWNRRLSTTVGVLALAIDPTSPLTIYAGTFGSGIFKSTDGGTNWSQVNTGLDDTSVFALAIHPATPGVVYAGTYGGRLFRTTNGGAMWTATPLTSRNSVVALAFNPQLPSTLYAGTWGDGAYKTVNGGTSWARINSGLFNQSGGSSVITVFALAVDPQSPATVYAGSFDNGVFKSTDGGENWALDNPGLPDDSEVHALAINASGTCLHAGTGGGIYDFASQLSSECPPPPTLTVTFSTTSQSVEVGGEAKTVATIRNLAGTSAAEARADFVPVSGEKCGITQITGAPTPFKFQAINSATNQPVAGVNTPVDITPGSSQAFAVTLTPFKSVCPLDIQFGFNCANSGLADIITGVNTLRLTAGAATLCGMSASASANQSAFTVGQTLIAGGSVTNAGLPGTAADFYVGILRPDNSVQFLTNTGIVVGNVGNLNSFRPIATNVSLAAPFSVSQPSVFTHQRTVTDPKGSYVFFVLAVRTGALAGGTLRNSDILRVATAPYTFP